jgi:transferase CAF17, mitochondrial
VAAGAAIPLEYNLDLLQGVTFDKGCYMGQELVARTHYQGLIRKRVMPVHLEPPCTDPVRQRALINASVHVEGKPRALGTLRGVMGRLGLAQLRLEETWEALRQRKGMWVELDGQRIAVKPRPPRWWPRELQPSLGFANLFL